MSRQKIDNRDVHVGHRLSKFFIRNCAIYGLAYIYVNNMQIQQLTIVYKQQFRKEIQLFIRDRSRNKYRRIDYELYEFGLDEIVCKNCL